MHYGWNSLSEEAKVKGWTDRQVGGGAVIVKQTVLKSFVII